MVALEGLLQHPRFSAVSRGDRTCRRELDNETWGCSVGLGALRFWSVVLVVPWLMTGSPVLPLSPCLASANLTPARGSSSEK